MLDSPLHAPLASAVASHLAREAPGFGPEAALAFLRGAERFLRLAPDGLGDHPETVAQLAVAARSLAARADLRDNLAGAPEGLGLLLASTWPDRPPSAFGSDLPAAILAACGGPVAARLLGPARLPGLIRDIAELGLPLPTAAAVPPALVSLLAADPLPILGRLHAAGGVAALAVLVPKLPADAAILPLLGHIAETTDVPALADACLTALEPHLGAYLGLLLRLRAEGRLGMDAAFRPGLHGLLRRAGAPNLANPAAAPPPAPPASPWPRRAAAEAVGDSDLARATELGEALADTLDHQGLRALTARMVAAAPHDPRTGVAAARLLRRAWRWEDWFAACHRLEEVAPRSAPAAVECVFGAIDERDFGRAWDAVRRARRLGASTAALRAEARVLHAEGRVDEVLAAWEAVCAQPDAGASDRHDRIIWLFGAGQDVAAEAAAAQAHARHPAEPRFAIKLAQAAERRRDYAAAAMAWGAIAARPDASADALPGLLRCLWMQDDRPALAAAIEAYRPPGAPHDLLFGLLDAWLRGEAAGLAALAEAVAALHRATRTQLAEARATWLADPGMVLLSGQPVPHPSPEHAAALQGAEAALRQMEAGQTVIVGNSPELIGHGGGPRIDAAGSVVRLNDARIGGFEADTGCRTTLWFSSANRLGEPDPGLRPEHAWLYQPEAQHLPPMALFCAGRLGVPAPSGSTFLPPDLHRFSNDLIYPKPTTGFRMVTTLAFALESPVAITGFDFFVRHGGHYFSTGRPLQVGEVHAVDFERRLVDEILVPAGRVRRW
ncbi:MAG: glycosyltransferase family 29 protein [Oceanibaculum sp.]